MPEYSPAERSWRMHKNIRWALWISLLAVGVFVATARITVFEVQIIRWMSGALLVGAIIAGVLERRTRLRIPRFQK